MKKPYKKPEVGDIVEIVVNGKKENGRLLESYDRGVLLLKLDNGYNIGFKKEDISELKVVSTPPPTTADDGKLKLSGKKPIVDFYLTGGTISSKLDPKTGGNTWLIDGRELFKVYPEIFEMCDVRIKSPFMKASEDMSNKDWIRLAKLIGKSLNDDQVKGVIVSHGTDFLHYTASALGFMLGKLNKPVVLTYSQRSSDRGSSDSRLNLVCSAHAALSDIAEVILVGHANSDDDYCYMLQGNKVRKMHTSRRDTFRPINCKPFGKVNAEGKVETFRDFNKRNKNKVEVNAFFDDRVVLLKFYPGQNPEILDYYRKKGYKGIIIEMSGLGHVISEGKNNWIPKLKEVIGKGMFVYAAAQTIYGRLDPFVYSPGRKLQDIGVVFLGDMLSETAFVKLGWVLGKKEWRGSVSTKNKMLENVNGEFNKRLGLDEW
ncbi:Glu-tRNA(Gln) amidotransferase GatDE subunit D [Candidatus Pacearchaeota archaeon]|nr:Glu-tRNA(Gln) amidotransferase GatDE subunit D [Candidatus Pacearchaeota archaeon]|tara:strand:- start:2958 stop:4247 length:1290 start_codon:yes stop_codon:yes gene_type:complete